MTVHLRRLAMLLAVLVVAGLALPFTANAQPGPAPSGGVTLTPATGSDITVISGTTSGPCTAAGANGLQVFVTGPGPFAANDAAGRPFGVALQAATPDGFSGSSPNTFTGRAGFLDLAHELGLNAVPPGTYTVDFRCVDVEFTTVFQTYRATVTFTSPTAYAIPGAAAAAATPAPGSVPAGSAPTGVGPTAPLPGDAGASGSAPGAPTDGSAVDRTAGSAGSPAGPGPALIVVIVVAALLVAGVIAYLVRRRRAPVSSSPRP